jgi:hypothetical protein
MATDGDVRIQPTLLESRLTPESTIKDFCAKYYGRAAPVMQGFWLAQEKRDKW